MTTHELAHLFDHLRAGLASGLKATTLQGFADVSEAFRELPDQPLKALVKTIKEKPATGRGGKQASPPIDLALLVERIRTVRSGAEPPEAVNADVDRLNNNQLKEVLKNFDLKATTKVDQNRYRVRQLVAPATNPNGSSETGATGQAFDPALVDRGVQTYRRLRDEKGLSIPEVRAQFEPVLHYSKPVVEEITRQLGYTPAGSREEMVRRLLSNLEGIKLSQLKGDWILSGV